MEIPTGTTSGTLAVMIAKPSNDNHESGFPSLFSLEACHGALVATTFYGDATDGTLIYECPDEMIVQSVVSIAPGIALYGNGAAVILPPYESPGLTGTVAVALGYSRSHDVLVMAPDWLIKKVFGTRLMHKSQQWQLDDNRHQDLAV